MDLSGNSITSIQLGAFKGASTGNLDLSGNSITSIQLGAFNGATINSNLDLSGNSITSIQPDAFQGAVIGGNLDLSGNSITSLQQYAFQTATIYGILDLSGNNITSIQQYAFKGASTGNLDLSGNSITSLQQDAFDSTSIVGSLNLSGNRMTSLQQYAFQGINVRGDLDLSDNIISSIAGGALSDASISNINLSNNRLSVLQAATFAGLKINGGVNLFRNNISVLENGWYLPFPLDVNLNMSGNPSQCAAGTLVSTVQTFRCQCAGDSRSSILGNGAYCDTAPCQHAKLPHNVDHGTVVCPSSSDATNYSSGQDCRLVCDRGYVAAAPFDSVITSTITCLGGVWGQRPNLANLFPTCVVQGGISTGEAIAIGVATGAVGVLVVLVLVVAYRRRLRVQSYNLELQEHLLAEQGAELEELREVFTIAGNDLTLEARIDDGSEGAFGQVWRAQWNDLTVAVKKMRAGLLALDAKYAAEFEAETALMRTLRHANVVTFFGAGTDEHGVPFLVCELMVASLQKRLWNARERVGEAQQVKWARDAARGMAFLHAKGLIHRDLKSPNLLGMFFLKKKKESKTARKRGGKKTKQKMTMTSHIYFLFILISSFRTVSARGTVKVADFGTAKLAGMLAGDGRARSVSSSSSAAAREQTTMVGTVLWMAPEVIGGGSDYGQVNNYNKRKKERKKEREQKNNEEKKGPW